MNKIRYRYLVLVGFCLRGILSSWDFVLWDFVGFFPTWDFVGFFPTWDFVLMGFYPDTPRSYGSYWNGLHLHNLHKKSLIF